MTEGLRKYAGLYQVDLLEAGTAYINVSYMAHDLSINIPLITTEGHTPLDLSLYFVLSRKTSLDEYYGKGTSSSFRYRVSSSQSPVITFPSGDEYSFTYA